MVVCTGVPKGVPVVPVVLETVTVVGRCVELTALGLPVMPEVVWPTGVPVTPMVNLVAMVVGPAVD